MTLLEPDRDQIEIFVDAMFRHAGREGYASVRSFFGDNEVFRISTAKLKGGLRHLIDVAEDDARRAANDPKPVVFCPPLAVFNGPDGWRARQDDLMKGLALSVECDQRPHEALRKLEEIFGPATLIVKSGGQWIDPDLRPQDKLHLHWRLNRPAMGGQLDRLKQARRLAAEVVGADASNIPTVHCLRWPGSWHRKNQPRLCAIATAAPDAEIDLDEALAKLEAAAPRPLRPTVDSSSEAKPEPWGEFAANIIAGTKLHESLTRLAAKYARSGTPKGAGINQTRALMDASAARHERPAEWQARFADIPRAFDTAYDKYGEAPETEARRASDGGGKGAAEPVLEVLDVGDDDQPIPPREWLLGNAFCRKFVSGLIAPGAGAKTSLRVAQALALTSGRSLTGEHVFVRANVLIICLDDEIDEARRRVRAAMIHHQVNRQEVKDRLFLSTPKRMKMAQYSPKGNSVVAGDLDRAVRTFVDERKIDLVMIDPIKKAHTVEENSNDAMDALVTILAALAIEKNIGVDVSSHERKSSQSEAGDVNRARGAGSMKDGGRLMYTNTWMTEDEAKAFDVPEDERRRLFRVDSAKVNIAKPSASAQWFRLVSVNLENGNDVYPSGDDVQTVERWTPPALFEGLSTHDLNKALDRLRAGMGDGRLYSTAPSAKARAAWRVLQEICPAQNEERCRKIIATWVKNGVLTIGSYYDEKERKENDGVTGAKMVGVEIEP